MRVVRALPLPRRVHRQPAPAGPGREDPPDARDHRAGPRRPAQRPTHLPSGSFAANSAWLVLAAIAFNLTRAAGCLASAFHAKATTGPIRAQLINIPARLARSARRLRMHLPQHWPWEQAWSQLFQATLAPPRPA